MHDSLRYSIAADVRPAAAEEGLPCSLSRSWRLSAAQGCQVANAAATVRFVQNESALELDSLACCACWTESTHVANAEPSVRPCRYASARPAASRLCARSRARSCQVWKAALRCSCSSLCTRSARQVAPALLLTCLLHAQQVASGAPGRVCTLFAQHQQAVVPWVQVHQAAMGHPAQQPAQAHLDALRSPGLQVAAPASIVPPRRKGSGNRAVHEVPHRLRCSRDERPALVDALAPAGKGRSPAPGAPVAEGLGCRLPPRSLGACKVLPGGKGLAQLALRQAACTGAAQSG